MRSRTTPMNHRNAMPAKGTMPSANGDLAAIGLEPAEIGGGIGGDRQPDEDVRRAEQHREHDAGDGSRSWSAQPMLDRSDRGRRSWSTASFTRHEASTAVDRTQQMPAWLATSTVSLRRRGAELSVHRHHVRLHGVARQVELVGDLGEGEVGGQVLQHLAARPRSTRRSTPEPIGASGSPRRRTSAIWSFTIRASGTRSSTRSAASSHSSLPVVSPRS